MERRLAAILSAYVVGYTRVMGVDEAGTLRRLTDLREKILEPLFDGEHGWWWRNRTGENVTIILRTSGRYGDIKQYR